MAGDSYFKTKGSGDGKTWFWKQAYPHFYYPRTPIIYKINKSPRKVIYKKKLDKVGLAILSIGLFGLFVSIL